MGRHYYRWRDTVGVGMSRTTIAGRRITGHRARVDGADGESWASCRCGWVGPDRTYEVAAEQDAERHDPNYVSPYADLY